MCYWGIYELFQHSCDNLKYGNVSFLFDHINEFRIMLHH